LAPKQPADIVNFKNYLTYIGLVPKDSKADFAQILDSMLANKTSSGVLETDRSENVKPAELIEDHADAVTQEGGEVSSTVVKHDHCDILASSLKVYMTALSYDEMHQVCLNFVDQWKTKIDQKVEKSQRKKKK
jgi:hypothetical protein